MSRFQNLESLLSPEKGQDRGLGDSGALEEYLLQTVDDGFVVRVLVVVVVDVVKSCVDTDVGQVAAEAHV